MIMRFVLTILYISTAFFCKAQQSFKTLVPQQPVVAGESFQVQYIVDGTAKLVNFKAPDFKYFRFVSGPNQYTGTVATSHGEKSLRNFVYTLEALKPGRFVIPGAVVTLNGKTIKSNDIVIDVISEQQAAKVNNKNISAYNSDYLLRPGEDPYEKIRQNLFLKMAVDKTSCYAGEPVLATFKLYSRLESKSDIVKNPGFYGFTVYDMVNLADKIMTTELINGITFDVHTIRKVQLFPLQEGRFIIDAMEVLNKVEFSRSIVNKKTEQQIAEGILGKKADDETEADKEIVETSMNTAPVTIIVKPVPAKNRPDGFNGAVGKFFISASLVKDSIAKNEEGIVEISVTGNGNFTQLNAPVIKWPAGIESFEPEIKDVLDRTKIPLTGNRIFRYTFVCSKPGTYHLPPVRFSFYDPDSNKYKTISTTSLTFIASDKEKIYTSGAEKKISIAEKNAKASRIAAGIIISLALLILIYWIRQKKEPDNIIAEKKNVLPNVAEMLAPVYSFIHASEKEFYTSLHLCIWNFFRAHFKLSGSEMKKEILTIKLEASAVNPEVIAEIQNIMLQCEEGMFTGVNFDSDKNSLVKETKETLEAINSSLL